MTYFLGPMSTIVFGVLADNFIPAKHDKSFLAMFVES